MEAFLIGIAVGAIAASVVFFFIWKNNKARVNDALEIAYTKFK